MDTAFLLVAHGSRHEEANDDLRHLAGEMIRRGLTTVEICFLELAEPGVEEGAVRCLRHGVRRVVLVPYFLSAGVHVRRDLRELCCKLSAQLAPVEFCLAEPLGRHPLLVDIVLDRAREAAGES